MLTQKTSLMKPRQPQLVDSHCHLDFAEFDDCRSSELSACRAAGLNTIVIPAVDPASFKHQFEIIDEHPELFGSVGLHPAWIESYAPSDPNCNQLTSQLALFSAHPSCIAVGETGLDKRINTPFDLQLKYCEQQLKFACDAKLPVLLHVRNAHNEMLGMLSRYNNIRGGIIHAFSGSPELALSYWRLGYHIGLGGVITYDRAKKTRRTAAQLPLEAIVLETDSPNMPLHGFKGEYNRPLRLTAIAKALAKIRGVSVNEIAGVTTSNCQGLFRF